MIKTIIFTQAFKQNLSKLAPKRTEKIEKTGQEIVDEISAEKIVVPLFKQIDLDVKLPTARKVILDDIQYEPVQRKFNVRPNRSEEVEKERREIRKKVEKPVGMLKDEEVEIFHVRKQVDRLYEQVRENDLRAGNN
jgi:hypothetical protein